LYRPWGTASWLLKAFGVPKWSFFGCVGAEDRSASAFSVLSPHLCNYNLVRIFDEQPKDAQEERSALDKRLSHFEALGASATWCSDQPLLATLDTIEGQFEIASQTDSVIIDITSLPKRWFFPLIRSVYNNSTINNAVVVYTAGSKYAASLSQNPELVRSLPGFAAIERRVEHDYAFVGVGFHSASMLPLFNEERPRRVKMLFPFPPGPPGMRRNWRFVEEVERIVKSDAQDDDLRDLVDHTQISAVDVSQNFQAMCKMTRNGEMTSLLAPYGPKPVSLAMCLFAVAAERAGKQEVPVYYSQPARYSLDYTGPVTGPVDPNRVSAYAIKIAGKEVYKL
jgi:hypothetical protein